MMPSDVQLSYRRSAIQGASPIGLVIALYDTLSGDLRRAASAIRSHDIEKRCAELNHASAVLGQLEDWIDVKSDGRLAESLSAFYGYLRARMMEAALRQSDSLLDEQIDLILLVRAAWQERDGISSAGSALSNQPLSADIKIQSVSAQQ
ncbi:MAG: flagellar export chaperone FliS [Acidobacteriaceae bacterium]|nr:flagellar export chaperone FliS [Acidobacteriaceae bacterium]